MQLHTIGYAPFKYAEKGNKSKIERENVIILSSNHTSLLQSTQNRLRSANKSPNSFKVTDLLSKKQNSHSPDKPKCTSPISSTNPTSPLDAVFEKRRKISSGYLSFSESQDKNKIKGVAEIQSSQEIQKQESKNSLQSTPSVSNNKQYSIQSSTQKNVFFNKFNSNFGNFTKIMNNCNNLRICNAVYQEDQLNSQEEREGIKSMDNEKIRASTDKLFQIIANPDEITQQLVKQNLMIFNRKKMANNIQNHNHTQVLPNTNTPLSSRTGNLLNRSNLNSARSPTYVQQKQSLIQQSERQVANLHEVKSQLSMISFKKQPQSVIQFSITQRNSIKNNSIRNEEASTNKKVESKNEQQYAGSSDAAQSQPKPHNFGNGNSTLYFSVRSAVGTTGEDKSITGIPSEVTHEDMTTTTSIYSPYLHLVESPKSRIIQNTVATMNNTNSSPKNDCNLDFYDTSPRHKIPMNGWINETKMIDKQNSNKGDDNNYKAQTLNSEQIKKGINNGDDFIDCREDQQLIRVIGSSQTPDYSKQLFKTEISQNANPMNMSQMYNQFYTPKLAKEGSNKHKLYLSLIEKEKSKYGAFEKTIEKEKTINRTTTMTFSYSKPTKINKKAACPNQKLFVSPSHKYLSDKLPSQKSSHEKSTVSEKMKYPTFQERIKQPTLCSFTVATPVLTQRDESQKLQQQEMKRMHEKQQQKEINEKLKISPWEELDKKETVDDSSLDFIQYTTIF